MDAISIASRFNGPPTSGNGGYSCGALAAHVEGPARVRLHLPPPLDTPLQVRHGEQGLVQMYHGKELVGTAEPYPFSLDIPPCPSLAQAVKASEGYPCYDHHVFGTCFVCGPSRPAHDGLELFPGPVKAGDWQLIACPWYVASDLVDSEGNVREEILWSALDCPGYFAAMGGELVHAVLGELDGEILKPVSGAEPLIVFAWPLGCEGRKHYGASAVATSSGEVVARSRSIWIELKNQG